MIIIKDDFLKNPYEVRNFALKQKYNTEGNYPGYRSFQVSDYLKDYILKEAKYHFKDQMRNRTSASYSRQPNPGDSNPH